jgi:hypothetical protein
MKPAVVFLSASLSLYLAAATLRADWARLRYVSQAGSPVLLYRPEDSASGTTASFLGVGPTRVVRVPRPNQVVSFRHPATGTSVSVPVAFPLATPRVEYRAAQVVYNYGSYTITIRFLADGSVDVVYSSGPFRPL